ncbi:hypothetical Protein YC6258_03998 [Gynuella sunshinyii YC6258]|uniref:Uncharacterized protein n=1 Tax=Gynuella sunshinyii YC6258 TaxID=1445510 RepID=A0A0C5W030_9GAMM|nr:hypothetical Protein YC6258_03998 [Gynuella sunshinyii YC6258]
MSVFYCEIGFFVAHLTGFSILNNQCLFWWQTRASASVSDRCHHHQA